MSYAAHLVLPRCHCPPLPQRHDLICLRHVWQPMMWQPMAAHATPPACHPPSMHLTGWGQRAKLQGGRLMQEQAHAPQRLVHRQVRRGLRRRRPAPGGRLRGLGGVWPHGAARGRRSGVDAAGWLAGAKHTITGLAALCSFPQAGPRIARRGLGGSLARRWGRWSSGPAEQPGSTSPTGVGWPIGRLLAGSTMAGTQCGYCPLHPLTGFCPRTPWTVDTSPHNTI